MMVTHRTGDGCSATCTMGMQDGHAQLPQVIDSQCYPICDTTGATLDTQLEQQDTSMKDLMNVMQDLTQLELKQDVLMAVCSPDGMLVLKLELILQHLKLAQKHVEMECLMLEKNVIQVPTMKPQLPL